MSVEIVRRGPQHYVGLREEVAPDGVGRVAARVPEVLALLQRLGLEVDGAPFLRYRVIEPGVLIDLEACAPVAAAPELDDQAADDGFAAGVLPGGAWAAAEHVGAPEGLAAGTRDLLAEAAEEGLTFDVDPAEHRWGGRIEELLTDPAVEPDPARRRTRILIRLSDASAAAVRPS